ADLLPVLHGFEQINIRYEEPVRSSLVAFVDISVTNQLNRLGARLRRSGKNPEVLQQILKTAAEHPQIVGVNSTCAARFRIQERNPAFKAGGDGSARGDVAVSPHYRGPKDHGRFS